MAITVELYKEVRRMHLDGVGRRQIATRLDISQNTVRKYLDGNKGIRVSPTVSWGDENTFDFCFSGIPKDSTVAVSTYMVSAIQ